MLKKLNLIFILCLASSGCSSTQNNYKSYSQNNTLYSSQDNVLYNSQDIADFTKNKLCQFFIKEKNINIEKLLIEELRERNIELCDAYDILKPVPFSKKEIARKNAERKAQIAQEKAKQEALRKKRDADELKQSIAEDALTNKAMSDGYLSLTGLVVGLSTPAQVKRRQNKREDVFVIGGFELGCSSSFLDEKLSSIVCAIGKDHGSIDILDGNKLKSNISIYATLKKGFSKKYGEPKIISSDMRTRLGVKYDVERSIWKDKRGNKLEIISRANNVDMGGLTFESIELIMQEIDTEEKEYKARNF